MLSVPSDSIFSDFMAEARKTTLSCIHLKHALCLCSWFHHPIIRLHSSQPPGNHKHQLPFSTHSAWSCTGAPSVTNGLYELLIAGRASGGRRSSARFLISSLKSHGKKTGSWKSFSSPHPPHPKEKKHDVYLASRLNCSSLTWLVVKKMN